MKYYFPWFLLFGAPALHASDEFSPYVTRLARHECMNRLMAVPTDYFPVLRFMPGIRVELRNIEAGIILGDDVAHGYRQLVFEPLSKETFRSLRATGFEGQRFLAVSFDEELSALFDATIDVLGGVTGRTVTADVPRGTLAITPAEVRRGVVLQINGRYFVAADDVRNDEVKVHEIRGRSRAEFVSMHPETLSFKTFRLGTAPVNDVKWMGEAEVRAAGDRMALGPWIADPARQTQTAVTGVKFGAMTPPRRPTF